MRTTLCIILALAALPAFAADPPAKTTPTTTPTNAPEATYSHENEAIAFHGPLDWGGYSSVTANNIGTSRGGYPVYSVHGGRTIYRPHMTIRLGADADWAYRHEKHPDPIDP
jgi:hypothetical protein